MKIKLNKNSSVVDYNIARTILCAVGYKLHRKDDTTLLVKLMNPKEYRFEFDGEQPDGRLSVDSGCFTSTMKDFEGNLSISNIGQELVDFCELLELITKIYNPEFKPASCSYIGHGRTKEHYISQYLSALESVEAVELVS